MHSLKLVFLSNLSLFTGIDVNTIIIVEDWSFPSYPSKKEQ